MYRLSFLMASTLVFAGTSPSSARAPVDPVTGVACELHVWPAHNFSARTQGIGAITGVLGTLDDDSAHRDRNEADRIRLAGYLAPDVQIADLKQLKLDDFVTGVVRSEYHGAITHSELEKTGTFSKTRSAASTAPCYDELFITFVNFERSPLLPARISFGVNAKTFDATSPKRRKDVFLVGRFEARDFMNPTNATPNIIRASFNAELVAVLRRVALKIAR